MSGGQCHSNRVSCQLVSVGWSGQVKLGGQFNSELMLVVVKVIKINM